MLQDFHTIGSSQELIKLCSTFSCILVEDILANHYTIDEGEKQCHVLEL